MRGFTLLESLLYIALFGLIMNGMLSGLWAFTESADRIQTQAFLETEGNFLMEKMQYDMRQAKTISQPVDTATTSELVLASADSASPEAYPNYGTYIELYLADTVLMRTQEKTSLPLSSNSVNVSDLSFKRLDTDSNDPESITIHFQITATTSDDQLVSQNFSSVEYLFP
jgi:type II secretory pathway pseudopilin PulG